MNCSFNDILYSFNDVISRILDAINTSGFQLKSDSASIKIGTTSPLVLSSSSIEVTSENSSLTVSGNNRTEAVTSLSTYSSTRNIPSTFSDTLQLNNGEIYQLAPITLNGNIKAYAYVLQSQIQDTDLYYSNCTPVLAILNYTYDFVKKDGSSLYVGNIHYEEVTITTDPNSKRLWHFRWGGEIIANKFMTEFQFDPYTTIPIAGENVFITQINFESAVYAGFLESFQGTITVNNKAYNISYDRSIVDFEWDAANALFTLKFNITNVPNWQTYFNWVTVPSNFNPMIYQDTPGYKGSKLSAQNGANSILVDLHIRDATVYSPTVDNVIFSYYNAYDGTVKVTYTIQHSSSSSGVTGFYVTTSSTTPTSSTVTTSQLIAWTSTSSSYSATISNLATGVSLTYYVYAYSLSGSTYTFSTGVTLAFTTIYPADYLFDTIVPCYSTNYLSLSFLNSKTIPGVSRYDFATNSSFSPVNTSITYSWAGLSISGLTVNTTYTIYIRLATNITIGSTSKEAYSSTFSINSADIQNPTVYAICNSSDNSLKIYSSDSTTVPTGMYYSSSTSFPSSSTITTSNLTPITSTITLSNQTANTIITYYLRNYYTSGSYTTVSYAYTTLNMMIISEITSPTITFGNTSATIVFTPVTNATGYQYAVNGSSTYTTFTPTTVSGSTNKTYTFSSLTNGTTYTYVIRAYYLNGTTSYTYTSGVTLTSGFPQPTLSAPSVSSITSSSSTAISITFSTSSTNATSYQYSTSSTFSSSTSFTSSTLSLTGLTADSTTTYYVRSVYTSGTNVAYSTTLTIPTAAMSTPTSLTASTGDNGSSTITFSSYSSAATAYQYSTNSFSSSTNFTPTLSTGSTYTYTITGLTNGTTYSVAIRAYYTSSSTTTYTSSTSSVSFTPLCYPIISSITSTSTTVTINVTTSSTGGDYSQYSTDNSTFTTISSNTFSITKTNSTPFSVYLKSYKTVSSVKYYSNTLTISTAVISPPTSVAITSGENAQTTLSFTTASGATSYQYSTSSSFTSYSSTTGTPTTITGLTNTSDYSYYLRSVYTSGSITTTSAASTVSNTARPFTSPTIRFALCPSSTSVTVYHSGLNTMTGYQASTTSNFTSTTTSTSGSNSLTCKDNSGSTSTTVYGLTISGLTNGSAYTIYVRSYYTASSTTTYSNTYSSIPVKIISAPTTFSITPGDQKFTLNSFTSITGITSYQYSINNTIQSSGEFTYADYKGTFYDTTTLPYTIQPTSKPTNGTLTYVYLRSVYTDSTTGLSTYSVINSTFYALPVSSLAYRKYYYFWVKFTYNWSVSPYSYTLYISQEQPTSTNYAEKSIGSATFTVDAANTPTSKYDSTYNYYLQGSTYVSVDIGLFGSDPSNPSSISPWYLYLKTNNASNNSDSNAFDISLSSSNYITFIPTGQSSKYPDVNYDVTIMNYNKYSTTRAASMTVSMTSRTATYLKT